MSARHRALTRLVNTSLLYVPRDTFQKTPGTLPMAHSRWLMQQGDARVHPSFIRLRQALVSHPGGVAGSSVFQDLEHEKRSEHWLPLIGPYYLHLSSGPEQRQRGGGRGTSCVDTRPPACPVPSCPVKHRCMLTGQLGRPVSGPVVLSSLAGPTWACQGASARQVHYPPTQRWEKKFV